MDKFLNLSTNLSTSIIPLKCNKVNKKIEKWGFLMLQNMNFATLLLLIC